MEQVLLALAVVIVAGFGLWFCIGKAYKADERDNSLVKYILLFDKKTKKFSEQRSDEFEEEEDVCMIGSNTHSILHSFNRFLSSEGYHVTTIYQAHKVYAIYLASRECKLEGHAN